MTPRSRRERTRPRHVDGATPARAASSLLGSRASRASSRTITRSIASRPAASPVARTTFGPSPPNAAGWEFSRVMPRLYRIICRIIYFRSKIMHHGSTASNKRKAVEVMKVGIPREVKNHEYRVAITPAGVHELTSHGHQVYLEKDAGGGSSLHDDAYVAAGATIISDPDEVWGVADMVLKVKEPIAEEYHRMRPGLVLFTYLHLAADKACTDALLASKVTSVAYETVQLADGSLPLLAPMSEVAGRLAPQVGAYHLIRSGGGYGALLGGVPGTYASRVVVIGAGVSGAHATQIAAGLGAQVTVLDKNVARLRQLDAHYQGRVQTVVSNAYEVERAVLGADLVVGAVLVAGAKAPKVVSN